MRSGDIEVDPRHTVRRMRTAMQGNCIRALVELITNSDDSYIRLEDKDRIQGGRIDILYEKEGYCCHFGIRDHAEGMSIDDVQRSFTKYGAATSGQEVGIKVRGYFGQGAKDAIASMADGKVCTFRDGAFVECRLFIKNGIAKYEIDEPVPATEELREKHGIDVNGTIAYFMVGGQETERVPRFETVHKELANNYLLRKIMTNQRRKVVLIDEASRKKRPLKYYLPMGKQLIDEEFPISWEKSGEFPIKFRMWRSENELTQSGDIRDGGLLIVDEENAVLDISLFKYDAEPLAARFFGEIKIGRFRELLGVGEAVLSEERNGLITRHPFCQKLILEIERRIEKEVKNERVRKQKEEQSKLDIEERRRYKRAFDILNEIAETEAQAVVNLGPRATDKIEDPPDGFCLYPSSAQITVGKRYRFELRLSTKIVKHGSVINIACTHPKLHALCSEIPISSADGTGILRKYITVEGMESNIEGFLKAFTDGKMTQVKVYVVPEKELLLSEGMVFQPETITLRPNQPRKVSLLVYIKLIEGGSKITLKSDNDSIHVSEEEIEVIEAEAIKHVAKYEIEVWGDGVGQEAIITAEYGPYLAILGVSVVSKELREDKGRSGMFNDPEFNYDELDPLQRTSYSSETGRVIIYGNFPSISHYLGDGCQFRKTLPAQVLIADLVAERCFHEIARKIIENRGVILNPETRHDRELQEAYTLSKKYGKRIHEALVDQNLIKESRH